MTVVGKFERSRAKCVIARPDPIYLDAYILLDVTSFLGYTAGALLGWGAATIRNRNDRIRQQNPKILTFVIPKGSADGSVESLMNAVLSIYVANQAVKLKPSGIKSRTQVSRNVSNALRVVAEERKKRDVSLSKLLRVLDIRHLLPDIDDAALYIEAERIDFFKRSMLL